MSPSAMRSPWRRTAAAASVLLLLLIDAREGQRTSEQGDVLADAASGPTFFACCATAVALSGVASGRSKAELPASRWAFGIGTALVAAGCGLRLWASRALERFHTPVVTIQADHRIISDGPYAHVRHPIYSGLLVSFVGLGLQSGTWPGLAACTLLPAAGAMRRISVEERALDNALGDEYRIYAQGRGRLLPRFG